VNKDCLTQTETMIALRTTSPQDRKAILDWVSYHDVARELVDSLPGLDAGEAWVCSPHWLGRHGQPAIQRARFRQRATFDSGATPTLRQQRKPATIADIDLGAILGRMEAVTEKAAQDDPKALRRKVAGLERMLAASAGADQKVAALEAEVQGLRGELAAALARPADRVNVPAFGPDATAALERAAASLQTVADAVGGHAASITAALARAQDASVPPAAPAPRAAASVTPVRPALPRPAPVEPQANAGDGGNASVTLGKAHRAVLGVLAQFPEGRSKTQLALLSGYSVKSSSFGNTLSALRTAGLINRGNPIQIMPEGVATIGDGWEPLPTGEALVDHWMTQLGKAERTILRYLLESYPQPRSKEDISAATDYSVTSSSFGNALSKLRSLELINREPGILASDTFAEEVGYAGSTR
jgi:uncharacterized protein